MTPERWQKVEELFHSALERQGEERAAFLDAACGGDESLRRQVESLLSSDGQEKGSIEMLPSVVAAGWMAEGQRKKIVGQVIGHYRVRALLGAGGMGEVYLAEDVTLGRKIALKLLPLQYTGDRERVRRFEQEARAASALNHPNIITIYEIGRWEGTHFIATELIEGETLRERMEHVPLPLGEILDVGIQVAGALAAAHTAGIVHRDIKPANIMIRRDGYAKVLDFGLAKLTMSSADSSATNQQPGTEPKTDPGRVMGTVTYMSPEQARGIQVDARTDIWSLGCVLYAMVTRHVPFEGATPSDIIAEILKVEPPLLVSYGREAPAELQRVVTKALRKDKEERYQAMRDLASDLKSLKQRLEFEAELKRAEMPGRNSEARPAATSGGSIAGTSTTAAAQTDAGDIHPTQVSAARNQSSAEYIVTEIKRHKRGVLALLLAAIVAVAYFAYALDLTGSGTAVAGTRSIVVLPFANAGGNLETEYLSDGISESLINSLSRLPGLKVIARSSAFRYKGKEAEAQEVARALGVDAILTGRVLQRGENLHISAELVDARDATQVWGEQYNRRATDLLAVQAEISREIAERLRLTLTAGAREQLAKRETTNPQAYELVLRGRFYHHKGGAENEKKAVEYFKQAVAVDPAYALAYAELSVSCRDLASALDPKDFMSEAESAAQKALGMDESLAEAHLALALIKRDAWEWMAAEREYKRALELNPNLAAAHLRYAFYLSLVGRHDEAIAEIERARELDPLSLFVNAHVGYILYFARRYDKAIEALEKTLELDQNSLKAHVFLGYTYAAKGMYARAIAEYHEAIKLGLDGPSMQVYLGVAYARGGEPERARDVLKRLQTNEEYVSPCELAVLYASLDEREQAFQSLERAYAAHDLQLQILGVDPAFDGLRADPRFADLMRRVGLTP